MHLSRICGVLDKCSFHLSFKPSFIHCSLNRNNVMERELYLNDSRSLGSEIVTPSPSIAIDPLR